MIVTPQKDRRNRRDALLSAGGVAALIGLCGLVEPYALLGLPAAAGVYAWCRRRMRRRARIATEPFPAAWEAALSQRVAFYLALEVEEKERFRQLVRIFLDEVRVTGIRTEVDDVVLALVGASAVIPIFGFPDWEYARLGEVLIYPRSFGSEYETDGKPGETTLGMVGMGQLRGVMILSKPDLLSGFELARDRLNVGVHEFTHLVDAADGRMDGLPPGVPRAVAQQWAAYVAAELREQSGEPGHIRPYAYTNEVEFFAVVAEYFFERPDALRAKEPELYRQLQTMFRQNTHERLAGIRLPAGVRRTRRQRIGRNARCPCGSGQKYKRCCLAGRR